MNKEESLDDLKCIIEIPSSEKEAFSEFIKKTRLQTIRSSQELIDDVFEENKELEKQLRDHKVSKLIEVCRESVWQKYLIEEAKFNVVVIKELRKKFNTPKNILDNLITSEILNKTGDSLREGIKDICGKYAGIIAPYVYALSLSNTQSRRARAGKTFEFIIYKIYDLLGYPFDSQNKVGRKIFDEAGLGKKVDSILPNIKAFHERRNKVIIGTMKTSLRER